MQVNPRVRIRDAERADVPLIFRLIVELAEYERAAEHVTGSEELLDRALFGPHPVVEAVIAETSEEAGAPEAGGSAQAGAPDGAAGEPVGFALFYTTFSTWQCLPGIWLEDLYVDPARRRGGVGRALFAHVAKVAVQRECGRLEWAALDWNSPALDFYESLGATVLSDWLTHRLAGEALRSVALGQIADPS